MLLSPLLGSISGSYSSNAGFPHRYPSGFPSTVHILHGWLHPFLWLQSLALNLWFSNNLQPRIFSRASHLHIQLPSEYLHLYVWQDPKCNLSKAELNVIPIISASPLVFYIPVTGAIAVADIGGYLPQIHPCFLLLVKPQFCSVQIYTMRPLSSSPDVSWMVENSFQQ